MMKSVLVVVVIVSVGRLRCRKGSISSPSLLAFLHYFLLEQTIHGVIGANHETEVVAATNKKFNSFVCGRNGVVSKIRIRRNIHTFFFF
jgi:hypothetical protein